MVNVFSIKNNFSLVKYNFFPLQALSIVASILSASRMTLFINLKILICGCFYSQQERCLRGRLCFLLFCPPQVLAYHTRYSIEGLNMSIYFNKQFTISTLLSMDFIPEKAISFFPGRPGARGRKK